MKAIHKSRDIGRSREEGLRILGGRQTSASLPATSDQPIPAPPAIEEVMPLHLAFKQRLAERARLQSSCPCGCADATARRLSIR